MKQMLSVVHFSIEILEHGKEQISLLQCSVNILCSKIIYSNFISSVIVNLLIIRSNPVN